MKKIKPLALTEFYVGNPRSINSSFWGKSSQPYNNFDGFFYAFNFHSSGIMVDFLDICRAKKSCLSTLNLAKTYQHNLAKETIVLI